MGIRLLSQLLRSKFLIERDFADSQLPLIASLINGQSVSFSSDKKNANPYFTNVSEWDEDGYKPLIALSASGSTVKASRWRSFDQAPEGSIALIPVTGAILKYGGECGEPGSTHMTDWISEAASSSKISAVVIRIDSPGGMVDGTATLADAIKNCNKPTTAFIDDGNCASAAMWIASPADKIYASRKTDMIGSIGVFCTLYDFEERLKMLGVKIHEIYAPQSSQKNEDYKEALKGKYDKIEAELSVICQEFISVIQTNRAGKLNLSAGDPFKGAMFFADQAEKIGLIDGIKSFDQVISELLSQGANTGGSAPTNKVTSNSTDMFGTNFKKVAALKDKKAEEITAEDIQAANTELAAAGITGVVLGTDKSSKIDELETELTAAKNAKTADDKTIADLRAEILTLGKTAGDTSTNAKKDSETASDTSVVTEFAKYDHNKSAMDEIKNL